MPCRGLITSANAIVLHIIKILNILSFCYVLDLMTSEKLNTHKSKLIRIKLIYFEGEGREGFAPLDFPQMPLSRLDGSSEVLVFFFKSIFIILNMFITFYLFLFFWSLLRGQGICIMPIARQDRPLTLSIQQIIITHSLTCIYHYE